MNLEQIEQENIIERYLSGKLSAGQEAEFEEYLLEHPELLERVQWAEDLQQSLQTAAWDPGLRREPQAQRLPAWLPSRSLPQQIALLAAVLLILVLPAGYLLWQQGGLREQLLQAQASAESAQQQAEQQRQAAARLQQELRTLREQQDARLQTIQDQLEQLARPEINTPIYSLGTARSDSGLPQIRLGESPRRIVVELELPPSQYPSYRASLLDQRQAALWQSSGLKATLQDTLSISFSSGFLRPGRYFWRVEGKIGDGRYEAVGEFPFRAVR